MEKGVKDLDLEDLPLERALGVHWCAEDDVFTFQVTLKEQPCPRQGILSIVSSMYDPLGFLAPVTFPAKHLLQELCRLNLSWDEDIRNTHTQSWKRWLIQKGVKWMFSPPAGAHHGGVWERIIRMVKRILSSITNQQSLDDEGLVRVMWEVESILNSRPMTTVSSDPNDLEPLTPNHPLQLKVQPLLPPGIFKQEDVYARSAMATDTVYRRSFLDAMDTGICSTHARTIQMVPHPSELLCGRHSSDR